MFPVGKQYFLDSDKVWNIRIDSVEHQGLCVGTFKDEPYILIITGQKSLYSSMAIEHTIYV